MAREPETVIVSIYVQSQLNANLTMIQATFLMETRRPANMDIGMPQMPRVNTAITVVQQQCLIGLSPMWTQPHSRTLAGTSQC